MTPQTIEQIVAAIMKPVSHIVRSFDRDDSMVSKNGKARPCFSRLRLSRLFLYFSYAIPSYQIRIHIITLEYIENASISKAHPE